MPSTNTVRLILKSISTYSSLRTGQILTLFPPILPLGQVASEKNFNMQGSLGVIKDARVELLSWSPRVFYHHNFVSQEEIALIIALSKNASVPTTVKNTVAIASDQEMIKLLDRRISRFTQIPSPNFEAPLVTVYDVDYTSEAHRDWFV